jgi:ABC-2 type transport system ATP-binding protein
MTAAFLEVRDVRKRYGATTALDGVSFDVREGEMFGLLGPNGAGKTTLLSIVSCLTAPDGGEVWVAGERVERSARDVRRLIGVVPQELAIYNDLTARENLTFFGRLYGPDGPDLRRRVDDLLAAVGLTERADHRAGTFSGGMKRRLNLAAGLVHGPRLLLLDEPTTGVDPQSRHLVFEKVRQANAAGMTVVYTSHYMEEVQGLCTRIGIMDAGRLIACDTLPNLLRLRDGVVTLRLRELTPALRERLKALPDCRLVEGAALQAEGGVTVRLVCAEVKLTLLRLGPVLQETGAELLGLDAEEPNLENVFLHLTGKALRDE